LRTLSGVSMDTGMSLLVYNLMRSSLPALGRAPALEPATR
jgi:hypothetical protein